MVTPILKTAFTDTATSPPWKINETRTVEGEYMVVGGSGPEFGLIACCPMKADAELIVRLGNAAPTTTPAPGMLGLADELEKSVRVGGDIVGARYVMSFSDIEKTFIVTALRTAAIVDCKDSVPRSAIREKAAEILRAPPVDAMASREVELQEEVEGLRLWQRARLELSDLDLKRSVRLELFLEQIAQITNVGRGDVISLQDALHNIHKLVEAALSSGSDKP